MAVDDLWYLAKKDAGGNKVPSQRNGRGKRWRVRNHGARTQLFEKKTDAERYDANVRADLARGQYIDPQEGKVTIRQWAETWRREQLHRESSANRVETALRLHVYPVLGTDEIARVRPSHIRSWVKDRSRVLAPATLRTIYGGILAPMFNAAVLDRVIGATPCVGIRLPELDSNDYTIATAEQVYALADSLPGWYRVVPLLVAGAGLRAGEVFGLEPTSVLWLKRELIVAHQLKDVPGRSPFLGEPKTKTSVRTVDLADAVGSELSRHVEQYPPVEMELTDETNPRSVTTRTTRLLFTTSRGTPLKRSAWSDVWRPAAVRVGLPPRFGLRDLRHYFATVLIFGGANVKTVQMAMGHSNPTVTLNTYVGYWPDALDRTRSLVDAALNVDTVRRGAVESGL